jgi:hypothetical protein
MTAMLDFGMLLPEINSDRMYSGAGSGPMLAAASAWKGLAAELRSTTLSYGSVLSALTGEEWHGPAATSMAAAATPYVAWMGTTAAQAEQTAAQAEGAAAAYEAAFAATVPPPLIAANRAQLMTLTATKHLESEHPGDRGHRGSVCRDVGLGRRCHVRLRRFVGCCHAVDSVHRAAAEHELLWPGGSVGGGQPGRGDPGRDAAIHADAADVGAAYHAAESCFAGVVFLPGVWTRRRSHRTGGWNPFAAGSATDTTGLNGLLNLFGSDTAFGQFMNANIWNTIFSSGFYMPSNTMAPFLGLLGAQTAGNAVGDAAGQAATGALAEALAPVGGVSDLGSAVSGGLGHASIIGPLSVPPSWAAPAALASPLSSTLGGTPMIAPRPWRRGCPECRLTAWAAKPTDAPCPNTASGPPLWHAHPPPDNAARGRAAVAAPRSGVESGRDIPGRFSTMPSAACVETAPRAKRPSELSATP